MSLVKCRLQSKYNSFLVKTTREWNGLPPEWKAGLPVLQFKTNYKKLYMMKTNPLFSYQSSMGCINQTRIRLGLSPLQDHLFTYNIVEDPICRFSHLDKENAKHYFLQCPTFTVQRIILLNMLLQTLPIEYTNTLDDKSLAHLLLSGNENLSLDVNRKIFDISQTFILTSKRFLMT